MKKDEFFKKYLFFILCSIIVVGAASYYFHVKDLKENTSTIIIDNIAKVVSLQTTAAEKETNKVKTTTSTVPNRAATLPPTESTTLELMLDINSAGAEELKQLNGIGEKLADEIISYRQEHGRFRNIEEIMNVKGIGEKIFMGIKNNIFVIDPVYETETNIPYNDDISFEITEHTSTLEELTPIDINTADAEVLMLLPHVDEDIASRIIDFRNKNERFSNEYELLLIEGLTRNEVSDIIKYIEIKKTT